MIASALEDIAQLYLEQGRALPVPKESAEDPKADWIGRITLPVHDILRRPS